MFKKIFENLENVQDKINFLNAFKDIKFPIDLLEINNKDDIKLLRFLSKRNFNIYDLCVKVDFEKVFQKNFKFIFNFLNKRKEKFTVNFINLNQYLSTNICCPIENKIPIFIKLFILSKRIFESNEYILNRINILKITKNFSSIELFYKDILIILTSDDTPFLDQKSFTFNTCFYKYLSTCSYINDAYIQVLLNFNINLNFNLNNYLNKQKNINVLLPNKLDKIYSSFFQIQIVNKVL